jgi:hypothetical protein
MVAVMVVENNKYTEKCIERFTPVECKVPISVPLDKHPE